MRRFKLHALILSILLTMLFSGCAPAEKGFTQKDLNDESLLTITWMQQAAEYRALCYQAFNIAKLRWDMDKEAGKRCIVVDIDETIIDNSPYDAAKIGTDRTYTPATWKEWCDSKEAVALPGAVEFLNYVVNSGGVVFYISNRSEKPGKFSVRESTINNLKKLGFPKVENEFVHLKNDTSSKKGRRERAAAMGYRIVLLMGDNLGDFSEVFDVKNSAGRSEMTDKRRSEFGDRFIVLPNPAYGSWESALYSSKLSSAEKHKIRLELLKKFKYKK